MRPSVCSVLLQACRVLLGLLWSVIVVIPWSVVVVAGERLRESEKAGFGCHVGVVNAAALSWVALLPLRFSVRVCSVRRRLNIFCTLPPSYAWRLDIPSCPRRLASHTAHQLLYNGVLTCAAAVENDKCTSYFIHNDVTPTPAWSDVTYAQVPVASVVGTALGESSERLHGVNPLKTSCFGCN